MLFHREEQNGYIVDTYPNGTIVKNIKLDDSAVNELTPEPSIEEKILANTETLVSNNSVLDVILGVTENE